MLKFSIVVPAYNEERTVAACLEALVNQNFPKDDYEIILVNNNSQDKTKAIAQRYGSVRIIDEPKQGYVHALIRGCQEAKGEVIVFTDADTLAPSSWLKQYAEAYQDKSVGSACGPAKYCPVFLSSLIAEGVLFLSGVFTKTTIGFNFSVRRDIYRASGGFTPEINFNADTYLMLKAKKYAKNAFLPHNWVISSSRHFHGFIGLEYVAKSIVNVINLAFFKRTVFYEFGAVREEKASKILKFFRRDPEVF